MGNKIIVIKLADGKFLGVLDASRALEVRRQTIYDYLHGDVHALGREKRERIVVRDHSRKVRR